MTTPEESSRLFPPWIAAGTVTALLVPLLYTAGWSYAYHYFERFNLGLMGLEIPKEYFFLYSYLSVKERFGVFLLILAVSLSVYLFGRCGFRKLVNLAGGTGWEIPVRSIPAFLVSVILFSLFRFFYWFGETAAVNAFDWQAKNDFKSYQRVRVWANAPETPGFGEAMKKEWEKGCYRLLMRNKDHLFLFYPEQSGGRMPTNIIPSGKIEMVRILTENVSCKGKNP